jgi:hypothetical protein
MTEAERASVLRRFRLAASAWLRRHGTVLLRITAVVVVVAVTAIAGFVCYGLVGPPG